jgi:hypothetical protein
MTTMTETTLRDMHRAARNDAVLNGAIALAGVALSIVGYVAMVPWPVYIVFAAIIVFGLYRAWQTAPVWSATNAELEQRERRPAAAVVSRYAVGDGSPRRANGKPHGGATQREREAVATETREESGEPRTTRFCGACGAPRVRESDQFCRSCGERLSAG